MPSSLVLFDIDGTLVRRAGPHHRHAIEGAVSRVTGLPSTTDGIPVHGMLDPDIITLMLQAPGFDFSKFQAAMPAILEAAQEIYESTVPPDLRDKCCPGVTDLLAEFERRGIVVALVTGNLTRIGWRKLERAGLASFFRFGAFGEMAATRGGLAKLAIEWARGEHLIDSNSRISLIGDAPQDVRAAHENSIQSIAVRTGITPPGDLEACFPHYLLDDLTRLDLSIV